MINEIRNVETLSRGKHRGKWIFGSFHKHLAVSPCIFNTEQERKDFFEENEKYLIIMDSFGDWNMPTNIIFKEIEKDTLGKYIGLKDKNGKRIFVGDIIKWDDMSDGAYWRFAVVELNPDIKFNCKPIKQINGVVNSSNKCFQYGSFTYQNTEKHIEVIGNIYDNPELLEG